MVITLKPDDIVKVKLTDHGRAVHFNSFISVQQHPDHRVPYTPPAVNVDGYSTFTIGHWAEIFGRHINSGSTKMCFERNLIFAHENSATTLEN
jgi:hypothetical protein